MKSELSFGNDGRFKIFADEKNILGTFRAITLTLFDLSVQAEGISKC